MKDFLQLVSKGKFTGAILFAFFVTTGVIGRIVDRVTATSQGLGNDTVELVVGVFIIVTGLGLVWIVLAFVIFVTLRDLGLVAKPKPPRKEPKK